MPNHLLQTPLLLAWLFACVAAFTIGPSAADAAVTVNLKDQLEKGLEARLPSEFAFLAKVVQMVENGTLPRSLVDSTFIWARRRPQRRFQYFERALRVRASRLGIRI